MAQKSSFVLVGLFVLILGIGLVAGILWLTTGGPPKDYDFYRVYMTESVSGLSVDAAVKYKGVNVGRVRDISLDPDNPEQVRILLVVLQGTPIKVDTVATLELQGITGLATVNLSGGSLEAPPLRALPGQDYAVIQSRPSLLVRLDDTVSELLGNLIETTDKMNTLLDEENQAVISRTLANTEILTARLATRADEIEGLIDELRLVAGNARLATGRLPNLLSQFENTASALETMANSLASAGATLEESSDVLQETIVASGSDIRSFTAGTLPEAASLVSELRDAAGSLRRISESIEADPSQVLFGVPEPPPGPGEKRP